MLNGNNLINTLTTNLTLLFHRALRRCGASRASRACSAAPSKIWLDDEVLRSNAHSGQHQRVGVVPVHVVQGWRPREPVLAYAARNDLQDEQRVRVLPKNAQTYEQAGEDVAYLATKSSRHQTTLFVTWTPVFSI